MSVVVDASVCVAALVDGGPEGRWAETLFAEQPLSAPQLILVESTNVLRRLTAAGRLSDLRLQLGPILETPCDTRRVQGGALVRRDGDQAARSSGRFWAWIAATAASSSSAATGFE